MKLKRFKYIAFSAFYLFLAGFISAADHHEEETESFGKSEYRSGFSTHSRGRGRVSFISERGEHKETPEEYRQRYAKKIEIYEKELEEYKEELVLKRIEADRKIARRSGVFLNGYRASGGFNRPPLPPKKISEEYKEIFDRRYEEARSLAEKHHKEIGDKIFHMRLEDEAEALGLSTYGDVKDLQDRIEGNKEFIRREEEKNVLFVLLLFQKKKHLLPHNHIHLN
jgi:hypothetical protein